MNPINSKSMMFRFLAIKKKDSVLLYGKYDQELAEGMSYDYKQVLIVTKKSDVPGNIYKFDNKTKKLARYKNFNLKLDMIIILDNVFWPLRTIYLNKNRMLSTLAPYMHSESRLAIITYNFCIKTLNCLLRPTLNCYKKILMLSKFECEAVYSIIYENNLPVQISLIFPKQLSQLQCLSENRTGIKRILAKLIWVEGCLDQKHLMVVKKC